MPWGWGLSPGLQKAGSWFESHRAPMRTCVSSPSNNFVATRFCCPREQVVEIVSVTLCSQVCKILRLSPVERGFNVLNR